MGWQLIRSKLAPVKALFRASHIAPAAHRLTLNIKGALALPQTVVCTAVGAFALLVVLAFVAGCTLVPFEARAGSIDADSVAIAVSITHRHGAVRPVPSLKASTQRTSKRISVRRIRSDAAAIGSAVVWTGRDFARASSPERIALAGARHANAVVGAAGRMLQSLNLLWFKLRE